MSVGELSFNRRAVRPMECLREGWLLIKEEYWLFLGITLIGVMLGSAVPFGILAGPMVCGIYLCLFRREAGQRVTFEMLFQGFNYFAQSLIAMLLLMVPVFLILFLFYGVFFVGLFALVGTTSSQPGGSPADAAPAWLFVIFCVGLTVVIVLFSILIGALFQFTLPLIVDRGLSGIEALKLSARAAWANLSGVLGLILLSTLLGFLGMLACYVGVVFVYPVSFAMVAVAYRQVFPAEGSVLFAPPPANWPPSSERVAGPEQTGIQGVQDRPVTATRSPDEKGIRRNDGTPGEGRLPE